MAIPEQKEGVFLEKKKAIVYVKEVLEKQERLQELNQAVQEISVALDKAQRALETYKARITEECAQIVKDQRSALENRLEKSVQTAAGRVEQAEKQRAREKEKQKKSHIANVNQDDKEHIRQMKQYIREDIKKDKIPFFCRSGLWFSLFMPKFPTDFLLLILFWLITGLGIPTLLYWLIPKHQIWQFYILLPVFVVLTTVFYIEMSRKIRSAHKETLERCRDKMNQIHESKKRMKKTEKQINRSDDESPYELKELDEKVRQNRRELELARRNQENGLEEFEQHTRQELTEEFRAKAQEKLDELTDGIDQLTRQKNLTMELASELQLSMVDEYEDYLGVENMNPARLKQILWNLEEGGADTLKEAMEM